MKTETIHKVIAGAKLINVKIFLKRLALTVMVIWGCKLFQCRKLQLKKGNLSHPE